MKLRKKMRIPEAIVDHPFEILVGFLCLETGLGMLLIGFAPSSATALLPEVLIRVWGLVLALGGTLLLSGIFLRYSKDKFMLGLLVERAGYYPLISGTLAYSVIILVRAGIAGMFPMLTYLVFAAICAIRHRQINYTVRQLRRLERNG